MKILLVGILSAASIAHTGCGETAPPPQLATDRPQQLAPADPVALRDSSKAAPVAQELPNIPEGAEWTIYCATISGPRHLARSKQLKIDLIKSTGLNDWYLLHRESESTIYFGFYRTYDPHDQKYRSDGVRAQAERKQIDAITDVDGGRPFKHAVFVRLDAPDPDAPPEWNLASIRRSEWLMEDPDKPFWSLQIAAYKDSPQRKQFAVEAVRQARAQGIEAYYFHGDSTSSVLIGTWPRKAVREQDSDQGEAVDPTQPIFVLPKQMPKGMSRDIRDSSGQRVKTMEPVTEILDPTLKAAIEMYPEHATNGTVNVRTAKNPNTGRSKEMPDRSFLVAIPAPGASESLITSADGVPGESVIDSRDLAPPPPAGSLGGRGGKLKSIGE